uniref:Uncharacterized protein TCIL3000_11_1620 n=1 Tax=Trypanosoma congolense (strain IL3000) TaxID=1068625 RepID=G0UZF9_TRYCI|nr:unnamed protein product [Trypanosoma congolense IL3000]
MKRTNVALSTSKLIDTISAAVEEPCCTRELSALLRFPCVRCSSLPFAPPPKWTSELQRRLQKSFPHLKRRHHILFMRAFIHPSFSTPEAASSTMSATAALGESFLLSVGGRLVIDAFEDLKREEALSLVSFVSSDAALSSVLRHHWEMEDMILTDASVQLFQRKAVQSTNGMVSWISAKGSRQVPDPYCAGVVKAMIGAVFLDEGLVPATNFVCRYVLEALE